jgi:hypothetical protein
LQDNTLLFAAGTTEPKIIIDSEPQEYYRYAAKREILSDASREFSLELQSFIFVPLSTAFVGFGRKKAQARCIMAALPCGQWPAEGGGLS